MNILAVDTSTFRLGVGIVAPGGVGFSRRWAEDGHSRPLFKRIRAAMNEVGLGTGDIDLLAVVSGPGSFTGLRIGMAGILGWGVAAGLPIQTVDTFAAMRASVPDSVYPLLIVVHSRGKDFYMQYLGSADSSIVPEPFVGSTDSGTNLPEGGCRVCGSGARSFLALRHGSGLDGYELAGPGFLEPDMIAVCSTAAALFSERDAPACDYGIEPYYMTLSQAQVRFESRERRT